jgi:LuxR family maltose regulon positive regulatory protein
MPDKMRTIASEAHLGLARICSERNDLAAAELHAQHCLELTRQVDGVDTFGSYAALLARLRLARADVPGAVAILARPKPSSASTISSLGCPKSMPRGC